MPERTPTRHPGGRTCQGGLVEIMFVLSLILWVLVGS